MSTIFKIIKAKSQKEIPDYEPIELLLKNIIKKFCYGKLINYKYQWENKISYLFKEEIENQNFQLVDNFVINTNFRDFQENIVDIYYQNTKINNYINIIIFI